MLTKENHANRAKRDWYDLRGLAYQQKYIYLLTIIYLFCPTLVWHKSTNRKFNKLNKLKQAMATIIINTTILIN